MLEAVLEQLWLVGTPLALAVMNGLKGKYGFAAVGSVLALLGFWLGALIPLAGVIVLAGAIRVGKTRLGLGTELRQEKASRVDAPVSGSRRKS